MTENAWMLTLAREEDSWKICDRLNLWHNFLEPCWSDLRIYLHHIKYRLNSMWFTYIPNSCNLFFNLIALGYQRHHRHPQIHGHRSIHLSVIEHSCFLWSPKPATSFDGLLFRLLLYSLSRYFYKIQARLYSNPNKIWSGFFLVQSLVMNLWHDITDRKTINKNIFLVYPFLIFLDRTFIFLDRTFSGGGGVRTNSFLTCLSTCSPETIFKPIWETQARPCLTELDTSTKQVKMHGLEDPGHMLDHRDPSQPLSC